MAVSRRAPIALLIATVVIVPLLMALIPTVAHGQLMWDFYNGSGNLNGWTVVNGDTHFRSGDGGGLTPGTTSNGFAHDGGHATFLVESPTFWFDGSTLSGTTVFSWGTSGGAGDQNNDGPNKFAGPTDVLSYNGGSSDSLGQKGLAFLNINSNTYDAVLFNQGNGGTDTYNLTNGDLTAAGVNLNQGYRLQYFENDQGGWGWGQLNFVNVAAGTNPPTSAGAELFNPGGTINWTDNVWLDDVTGTGNPTGTHPQNNAGVVNPANITEGQVNVTANAEAFSLTMDTGSNGSGGRPGNGSLQVVSGSTLSINNDARILNDSQVLVDTGSTLQVNGTLEVGPNVSFQTSGTTQASQLAGSGTIVINNGGKLSANGGSIGEIDLNGTATEIESNGSLSVMTLSSNNNTVTKTGAGDLDVTGNTTLGADADYDITAGTLRHSGAISGGFGINKTGDGTLALATANSYTGTTTIDDGQVHITATGALGTTAGGTDINSGGALVVGGSGNINVVDDITLGSTGDGGAFNGGIYNQGNDNNLDGQLTVDGNSRIRVDNNRLRIRGGLALNNNLEINTDGGTAAEINTTAITGGSELTKEGDGTLDVRVDSPTYTGTVDINNGVVDVTTSQGLGTGTVEVDGDATLRLRSNINIGNAIVLSGTAGGGSGEGNQGRIRNDADNNTISGNIAWNDDSQVQVDSGTTLTLSGVISGSGKINKDSSQTGRLEINNTGNTFTGNVGIGAGTAAFEGNGSLGNAGSIIVGAGATLELNNIGTHGADVNIAGDGQGGVGAIHSVAGDNTLTGAVNITGTTIANSAAGTELQLTGPVTLGTSTNVTFDATGDITISQAFGNGNVPISFNAFDETIWNDPTPGSVATSDAFDNIEAYRAQVSNLGASDARGLLTSRLHYNADGDVSLRAANLGASGFNDGDFSMLWVTEFTPDESGDWGFRNNNVDDRYSFWVDLNQDGVFQSDERFFGRSSCCAGSGDTLISDATSTVDSLTGGETYLLGFVMNDTGGGGYFRDLEFARPSASTTFIDVDPSANPGLFQVTFDPDNSVVKNGAGNLRLDGDNTYNGTTTVNAGTLTINGTTSDQGSYTVVSGATLAGNGNIGLRAGESIDISGSPGIISPGDAGASYSGPGNANYSMGQDAATVGTLTITGADATSTLNMGGILQIDIFDATTFDQLLVGPGTVNLDDTTSILEINGSQTFTDLDLSAFDGGIFDFLVADDPINGEFSNVLLDDLQEDASGTAFAFQLNEDGNTLSLLVGSAAVVPEPATLLLWSLIGVGLLGCGVARRRGK